MEQQTSSGSLSTLRVDPHSSLPIAAQLSSQLRWQIASGGLRPDDELPSLHEAAADLGVNYHTVRAS